MTRNDLKVTDQKMIIFWKKLHDAMILKLRTTEWFVFILMTRNNLKVTDQKMIIFESNDTTP